MNLEEYEQKREQYEQFTVFVKDILLAAIKRAAEDGSYKYHLQQIHPRTKTYISLRDRLLKSGQENANNIEDIRNDLAGCRVIFYYNNDVNVFLRSRLIEDNFKVVDYKIHGPKDENISTNELYTANHYIVELNEDRALLPEYSVYRGLKCEIQIHTVLTNAWSETAHDITYKRPKTDGFGSRLLKDIDARLQKLMTEYLIPAGYEFQKIQHDWQRFLEGKVLFDREIEQEIGKCQDNNKLFEILKQYRESTLPLYDADCIKGEINNIVKIVKIAISSARAMRQTTISTPFGSMPGKTSKDILAIGLSILNFIQYFDIELIFAYLVELYKTSSEEKRKLIHESASKLAKYKVKILSEVGFFVQDVILKCLEELDKTTLTNIKGLVTHIGHTILDSSIEDISANYKSFTIKHNSLPGIEITGNIRQRMLTLLKKIYTPNDPYQEKREIIKAFNIACSTPHLSNYSDALLALILRNSTDIIDFYISIISAENYEILESIEADVCFLYQRAHDILEGSKVRDSECLQQCSELISSALQFREQLNLDEEYVVYKTLVGFESVFNEVWDDNTWKIRGEEQYRLEKIEEYVSNINDNTQSFWGEIIIMCTQAKSNALATFIYFGKFLKLLAEQRPDFVFYLLEEYQNELSNFLCPILDGLMISDNEKTLFLMNKWVDQGEYLGDCARVFEYYQPLDKLLVTKIFNKSKNNGDTYALCKVISAVTKSFNSDKLFLIKDLLLPAVHELTKLKNTQWAFDHWYRSEWQKVVGVLEDQEIAIILDNLLLIDKINYQIEKILEPIAEKSPQAILEFFNKRISNEGNHNNSVNHFEPIPFNFTYLHKPLSKSYQLILDTITGWYDGEYGNFIFGGAKLIHIIFPNWPDNLEKYLIDMVKSKRETSAQTTMAILRNYNGCLLVYPLCKELIKVLPEQDKDKGLSEISNILTSTDVVSGEFGLANAYEDKKREIESWEQDDNQKVKTFAAAFVSKLDKIIISERRRVNEDIALQKHRFGDEEL